MCPVKLYYVNRSGSDNMVLTKENRINRKDNNEPNNRNIPKLLPPRPGKGLNMFVNRIVKFCDGGNKPLAYKIPKSTSVLPQAKPDNHRLSFADDPPYSTTVGKNILKSYQIPKCKCCDQAPLRSNTTGNLLSAKPAQYILLRDKLPKWIHANDFIK
ncbi:hypothetical protein QE152_g10949 [Popillia japonica]|uniref:Uncharacterized protein n=1 Tax=Popillia japonica TaxID=7064 RepID=A0AAW1LTL6_POPJA